MKETCHVYNTAVCKCSQSLNDTIVVAVDTDAQGSLLSLDGRHYVVLPLFADPIPDGYVFGEVRALEGFVVATLKKST
jgi:hypothetical protein